MRSSLLLILLAGSFGVAYAQQHAEPEIRNAVLPLFPYNAGGSSDAGTVSIFAEVDTTGKTTQLEASGGNETLRQAAKDAAREWEFAAGAPRKIDIDFAFVLVNSEANICRASIRLGVPIRVKVCAFRRQRVTVY